MARTTIALGLYFQKKAFNLGERTKARQYNKPMVAEVAALITNNFDDGVHTRDVIVDSKDSAKRESQNCTQATWHFNIHCFSHMAKMGSMRKYHITPTKDLYNNVCDAITRGDTNAEGLRKRIVLAETFTGGPRYMMSNYQDAMALCRTYGNPDLFITFTSNPKWPEIFEMLSYLPGQKPHDRPKVVIYIIEFQKGGLPHVHILLWLEEHCKCNTLAQIDDIILAEIPSQLEDPEGYKVVTEFMLHDPCGKDAKHAPCNIEEKCSKHFPKSFNEETITDADGYPIYHRRDNKSFATKGKFKPLKLWKENWEAMFEDILHKNRKLFKYSELQLSSEQIQNYCIMEIKELLNRHGRDLSDFSDLPKPNPKLVTNIDNRWIKEALTFDMNKSKTKHQQFHVLLNPEQRLIYEQVLHSVYNQEGKFYFMYGLGGTGKTFLYKTIMARLRLERMIVLAVASSGIASLLLPGEDEATWIEIPERFLIKEWTNPIEQIVQETYPDFTTRQHDNDYLKERAILTPRNDDSDAINAYMFKKLAGDTVTYTSADEICKVSTDTIEQHNLYPVEFLNSLNFPGMPPHSLCLKKELTIMLIQKVNPSKGLCNGTRLIITDLVQFVIWAKILTGSHVGDNVLIHRIILTSTQSKWPFVLNRRQFPIGPCYAMTINKSQGQSLNHVGLYLPNLVFSHGQLYVALFKVTDHEGLKILMILDQNKELHNHTRNIVFKETFNNLT
ncbi:ATP-dependent DNA helicase PIF1-like protein [Tanacetum coccineum]